MVSSGKIRNRDLTECPKEQMYCYFCAFNPYYNSTNVYTEKRVKPAFDSYMKIDFHEQATATITSTAHSHSVCAENVKGSYTLHFV